MVDEFLMLLFQAGPVQCEDPGILQDIMEMRKPSSTRFQVRVQILIFREISRWTDVSGFNPGYGFLCLRIKQPQRGDCGTFKLQAYG